MNALLKPLLVAGFALLALTGCSKDNIPTAGTEYTVIATPITDAPDVVEVFSLACGGCRSIETILPELEAQANVEMAKVHVTFNESAQRAAYIYYAAAMQNNGKPSSAMMQDLFAYTQDGVENATAEQKKAEMQALFSKYQQLSPVDLSQAQHEAIYQQMLAAESFVESSNVASVPAFVVKGKYLVNSAAHKTVEDMVATISYLNGLPE